jgi:hypothetical protein
MLVKAAGAIGVPPSSLLPPEGGANAQLPGSMMLMAQVHGGDALIEAYASISSPKLRLAVLSLARTLAGGGKVDDLDGGRVGRARRLGCEAARMGVCGGLRPRRNSVGDDAVDGRAGMRPAKPT